MDKKLKQLYNRKSAQFRHQDLQHLPHDIFSDFNSKKIMKSHMTGKGVRLQLDDEEAEYLGGKFGGFKKIGSAFKKVGDKLGDTKNMHYGKNVIKVMDFQNKMAQKIAGATSGVPGLNRATAAIALGNEKLTGMAHDVHDSRKQGGNPGKIFKRALGRTVAREGSQLIQDKMGELQGEATDYAQGQVNNYLGAGFGKALNKGMKVGKQVNNSTKKAGLNYTVGQMVKSYDDENQISNRLKDNVSNRLNQESEKINNRVLSQFDRLNNGISGGSFKYEPKYNMNDIRSTAGSFRTSGSGLGRRYSKSAGNRSGVGGSFMTSGSGFGIYDDLSPFLRSDQPSFTPLRQSSLRSQKGF